MSILQDELPGAVVLDCCAGSGALGLEALSRGAAHATFVEQDPRVRRVLRENIAALGATDRATIVGQDALRYVRGLPAAAVDVAFADPPYAGPVARGLVEAWQATPFARTLAVEHAARDPLPPGDDRRRYGDTAISFYRIADPSA